MSNLNLEMCTKSLSIVQPVAMPRGTPDFEAKRASLLKAFAEKIPLDYLLPKELLDNPPVDVSSVPTTCGILTEEEIDITETHDAVGLADAIANKKYSAVAVAMAFSKRAIISHQLTCCLTQWFMDEAVEQAKRLDGYLAEHGKTVGPLHGVPISIKDHVPIAGTFSSLGCFSSIIEDDKDSHIIAILRAMGAVFYCKTNQPQTLMHLESDSLWGRVLNPFNINLSAGGSTGGEAALIAMKGSVLGVGSDIGGSIRAPAAFCGIYGFKPTSTLLPMKSIIATPSVAELNISGSIGPMCRSLRDLDLFMNSVLAAKPHLADPKVVPFPWTGLKTPMNRPLKIGIINNDGFIEPQPPVKRAISWARKLLSDPKHADLVEVKEFKPFGAAESWTKIRKMYWPDGGQASRSAIQATGEPLHPLSEWIWKDEAPKGMRNAQDVTMARRERDDFRCDFAESWNVQDVDVVLSPAFVGPASAHDTAFYWTYTSLYNFVDYPGVVVPTPIKAQAAEEYEPGYVPLSDACKHVKELWDRSNFDTAPINLQLIGRNNHDNELFGALKVLRDILHLS
ncbi:acetamidase [Dactylonectria macrodidyma]|uniref:Acetamidase n=1 Tax=Dactylonectria macrodidyma TaxID=307937 RepID=A0A9P9DGU6_9HYPO|nr:acetamidase [Dactylonectria macrodidyma]